ncbi:GWxTD domain-containing protein [candidate division KSB1 bacterium]|nr:GWxTD domain-containing protein [candidate division KSB1 bacterium]
MFRKAWLVVFVGLSIFVPVILWAQMEVDYAVFQYDSSVSCWEIYYTIPKNRLTYLPQAQGISHAQVRLRLAITQNNVVWKELAWELQDNLPDSIPITTGLNMLDRVQVLAPAGLYAATLKLQDLNNLAYVDSVAFTTTVVDFPPSRLGLSHIELASSIVKDATDKNSPFYKNSLLVIPNPNRIFGELPSRLLFYVETYHLLNYIPGDNYQLRYSILDQTGRVLDQKFRKRQKQVDARVEIESVSLRSIPTGEYTLHLALTDSSGQEFIAQNAGFFVQHPPAVVAAATDLTESDLIERSEFGGMNQAQLDQDFEYTVYFISKEEKNIYKSLSDVEAKRRFLFAFWQKKDPDAATILNEFRREYLNRIQSANERFSAFKKEGWRTDRGRVLVLYGEPSYIERTPSGAGQRPFEVWEYNEIQGGVKFIFADLSGFKDFLLLHSTARGEIHDDNYEARIRSGF